MVADRTLQLLKKMARRELVAMAGEFKPPVDVKNSWNATKLAGAIRKRQIADETATPEKDPADNEKFEDALGGDPPVEDTRGGKRDGAGRTPGMTDEKAKVRALPKVANQALKNGFQMLFGIWAMRAKIDEVALTDDEAERLALPYTQIQEYYFPGAVPEIADAILSAVYFTGEIAYLKIKIIKETRKANGTASNNSDREAGDGENGKGKEAGGERAENNNL